MKFNPHHHVVQRSRKCGAITLLPLYAFMAWTGKILPYFAECSNFTAKWSDFINKGSLCTIILGYFNLRTKNYLQTKGKKGNVVPVHAIKAYMKSRTIAQPILNLSTRWRSVDNFTSSMLYFEKRNRAGLGYFEKKKISCPRHDSNPRSYILKPCN